MNNMEIYNAAAEVPQIAQKTISAGRLKGMTDVNPMWRIEKLTETFGPCGIGWAYTITDKRLEKGANDTVAAFVDIDLMYKRDGEWSVPIPGTGGSMFVSSEKNGLYTSDECFKMALTDAISVAAKALGIGAKVYWKHAGTKYSAPGGSAPTIEDVNARFNDASPYDDPEYISTDQRQTLIDECRKLWGEKASAELRDRFGVVGARGLEQLEVKRWIEIMRELEALSRGDNS